MREYVQKRVKYINDWPDVIPFELDTKYQDHIKKYETENQNFPYKPMKLWEDEDKYYNIAISVIIDSLDFIDRFPHHAFAATFRGIDIYGKHLFNDDNETRCLKRLTSHFLQLINRNADVKEIFECIYNNMPVAVAQFLFSELFKQKSKNNEISRTYRRVSQDMNGKNIEKRNILLDEIYSKYGYDSNNYNDSIRKGSMLLCRIFQKDKIELNQKQINITSDIKLDFLLSGILFALRNNYMHGLVMSMSQSSKASIKSYMMYYYSFLIAQIVLNLLLIEGSTQINKPEKYKDLNVNTKENICNMTKLFGNYCKK